ncbi:hypothetical protein [Desulfofustis phage LS06-2018-MD01]|jgi:hypothetical protein|nr:hypothetical protein [Desulfofustis phage LS06-2018-MD01]
MALKLVKVGTTDEFSFGDESDPIINSVTLDGSGGTKVSNELQIDLYADSGFYIDPISLEVVSPDAGIVYQCSLDGVNFYDINPFILPVVDAVSTPQRIPLYLRVVVDNDGTVSAGSYTNPDLKLIATQIE